MERTDMRMCRACHRILAALLLGALSIPRICSASDAPAWMRQQVNAVLPAHDEKANAVILFEETILTVQPSGKIKRLDRQVLRILRPDGESRGTHHFYFDATSPITDMHAWCIPPAGKDYELKQKDVIESAVMDVDGGELISDLRMKTLRIPAATVGSVVGYEVEQELKPNFLVDDWDFQDDVPVREARYTLRLPNGWSYESAWLNHSNESPTSPAPNQWSWSIHDIEAVRVELHMPPWRGIAGRLVVALIPPGGKGSGIKSWNDIGSWYSSLTAGRREASSQIKQKVAETTASAPTLLAKIQALASFVQSDIRYVAIELGIGGHQPHPAAEVFSHRYGDCKDKATLLSSMLKEIGIESYYVIINTERGSVSADTPPNLYFNHAILAIVLPGGVDATALSARVSHPKLGQLLFFDPTDELTPLGSLSGPLQANYGMLVTPDGGELIELPQLPAETNGVARTAKMTLDEKGTLLGEVQEIRVGDEAATQRYTLRAAILDTDRIKSVEAVASSSFAKFEILKATVRNLRLPDRPFEWHYTLQSENYAKAAGDLLLVRPRVIGSKGSGLLETKEPRRHPIEFAGPQRDTDAFEIAVPPGYVVDELPPKVDIEVGFASYHSKTEFSGGSLRYTRSFEIKEVSVPVSKAEQLKRLYREIENDERNSAVLKRISQ
jgi:transglutaminase-like putative cysteine protease